MVVPKAPENFSVIPLTHVAPLPAQALERGWEAPPLAQVTVRVRGRVRVRVTNPNQDGIFRPSEGGGGGASSRRLRR